MAKQTLIPKDFVKKLEKDIKKSVEQEAKKHPEKFLNGHVGDTVPGNCKRCGTPQMVIIHGGKVRCTECGYTSSVALDLNWR